MNIADPIDSPPRFSERCLQALYGPFGILLAAALLLATVPLAGSFWLDETITAWLTAEPFNDMLRDSLQYQSHSPFTFALFWFWRRVFGSSEIIFRLPALLSAAATLFCIYQIGKLLSGPELGAWSALLLLCHESFLKSALSARPYCFALLFAMASVLYLMRWIENEKKVSLAVSMTSLMLAFYSHYFFIGVVSVHLAALLVCPQRWKMLKMYVLALVSAMLFAVPGLLHFVQLTSRQGLYHFSGLPSLQDFAQAICPPLLALYLVFAAALAFVLGRATVSGPEALRLRPAFAGFLIPLFVWALVPPALFFVHSRLSGSTLFFWRFYLWAAPATTLLLALVMGRLRPVRARAIAFLCVIVFVALVPRRWSVEDWRGAAAMVNRTLAQAPQIPVLAYSGLIELENITWLSDARHQRYLLSPFQVYALDAKPLAIPSGFISSEAAQYFQSAIVPVLDNNRRVLLVSSHMAQFASADGSGAMPEYFLSLMEQRGFSTEFLMKSGSVWVILFSRRYA